MGKGITKSFSKAGIIYGLGGAVRKLSGFLLLPFLTQRLTPTDYGVFALISILLVGFTGIANLGTGNSLSILFFQEDDSKKRENLIWTNFILLFFTNLVLLLFVVIFSKNISQVVLKTELYSEFIVVSFFGLSLRVLSDPFMNYLRMIEQPLKYISINIFGTAAFVLLIIYNVIYLDQGLVGYVYAITLSQFISLLLIILWVGSHLSFKLIKGKILPLVKIGFPSIFGIFAFVLIDYSDRELIHLFLGLDSLGIYSVAYSFGMLVVLFTDAFSLVWAPFFNSYINKQSEAKFIFPSILNVYLALSFSILILIFGCSKPIFYLLTESSYHSGYSIIGLISFSYLMKGVYLIFLPGFYFNKKLHLISLIEWVSAILNIILNLIMIPKLGLLGAAFATALSYLALCVISYFKGYKYLEINYQWITILKTTLISSIALALILMLNEVQFYIQYIEYLIGGFIAIVSIYFLFQINKKHITL